MKLKGDYGRSLGWLFVLCIIFPLIIGMLVFSLNNKIIEESELREKNFAQFNNIKKKIPTYEKEIDSFSTQFEIASFQLKNDFRKEMIELSKRLSSLSEFSKEIILPVLSAERFLGRNPYEKGHFFSDKVIFTIEGRYQSCFQFLHCLESVYPNLFVIDYVMAPKKNLDPDSTLSMKVGYILYKLPEKNPPSTVTPVTPIKK